MLAAGSLLWAPPSEFHATANDLFTEVAVQADGKIVAVGTVQGPNGDEDFLIARYTADGRLDASFGGSGTGWRSVDFGADGDDLATSVVIQNDGKIVVGGARNIPSPSMGGLQAFALVRLNRDGSLDNTFGSGGLVSTFLGGNFTMSLALTSTGKIVAAGDASFGFNGAVLRYLPNGQLDNSFDGDGMLLLQEYPLRGVAVDASDRIVIAGGQGANAKVSRLTVSGAFDGTFGVGGSKTITFDVGDNVTLDGLTLDADGRIVVVGDSSVDHQRQGGVARLLSGDGEYDNTFDGNGRVSIDLVADADEFLEDVAALPNGGLVLLGWNDGATRTWSLTVLTEAGLPDTGFDGDGTVFFAPTVNSFPWGVAVTKAGHYVIVGQIDTGDDRGAVIRAYEGRFPRRDDFLGWTDSGQWWVAESDGDSFQTGYYGQWDPSLGWKVVASNDFNGDGLADVAGRDGSGRWWVGLNTGSGFATSLWSVWDETAGWRDVRYNDFNGDGKADVAGRTSTGVWWVMLSTGTGFGAATVWARWLESAGWRDVIAADYTGDGRTDIAARASNGDWWVAVSTGAAFATSLWAGWNESAGWRDVRAGDFNGDGRFDLAGRTSGGQWWVSRSIGTAFATSLWGNWIESAGWRDVVVGDFNGDGLADIAGRTSAGQWQVAQSNGGSFSNVSFGSWDETEGWRDVRVGDFDGDGKSDIAGRTSAGEWWVSRSTGAAFTQSQWGTWDESAGWRTYRGEFKPTVT